MRDADLKTELLARKSKLVAQQAKIAAQLRGLDAAIKAIFNDTEPELPMEEERKKVNGHTHAVDIKTAVDMAITQSPKELSVRDILTWLQINYPEFGEKKQYVGNLFWALAKDRGLVVVRKGSGRAPTIYKKL